MNCAKCRYVLSDLDAECPRCKILQTQQAIAHPATSGPALAAHSPVLPPESKTPAAGGIAGSKPAPGASPVTAAGAPTIALNAVTSATQVLSDPPASLANFDYRCVVCKSDQIQKVPSIVKAGRWTGERQWSDSTQWSENSKTNAVSNLAGGAYNFGNDSVSVGGGQMRTRGNTNTSGSSGTSGQEASSGATELAHALEPPQLHLPSISAPTPSIEFSPLSAGCGCFATLFIGYPVLLAANGLNQRDIAEFTSLPILVLLLCLCFAFGLTIAYGNKQNRLKDEIEVKRWQGKCAAVMQDQEEDRHTHNVAMQRWGELFYCHRCDHVFLPGTNQAVRVERMHDLLKT